MAWTLPIGAQPDEAGTRFRVWAPTARHVEVLLYAGKTPTATHRLSPDADGYFAGYITGVRPGARYRYRLDDGPPRPDPASRFQPEGPHGPSAVVDPQFSWRDNGWRGVLLHNLVVYELHVGTATPEGTFESLIPRLDTLKALGVTAIELMPVADWPGTRNWGYDGVNLFAPARAYGGPEGLRRLVDAAHARGLGVILDVVYNHLGPDGNYLRDLSPFYFTDRHKTPWGDGINYDGPHSAEVRAFVVANALHWTHEYHIDGLRLDATDTIADDSPTHIIGELAATLRASLPEGRAFLVIAENAQNDPAIITPAAAGGWGCDAVWADDFHHQVRVALTGESDGYYADFKGTAADLARTIFQGWFYTGQTSVHWGRPRGAPANHIAPPHFVYCIQNHDQVGNRAMGDRLHHHVGLDAYRAASALLLFAPQTPLIWMGQEWAASSPFQFFTDHNPELGRLVTEGRRKEFAGFAAFSGETVPDPQDPATFERSKLRWEERETMPHQGVLQLYTDLLAMRHAHPALSFGGTLTVAALGPNAIVLGRTAPTGGQRLALVVNLGDATTVKLEPGGPWEPLLDTEDPRYGGRGPATLNGTTIQFAGPGAVLLAERG